VSDRFAVGDQVEVFIYRRWRPGLVIALGRVRVTVKYYMRPHRMRPRVGDFSPGRVRATAPEPQAP
jgi:hypothetical protein